MIRVLIVDDSQTLRTLIRAVIESDPAFDVVGVASNGEQAVRLCTRLQPDIITMDIRMPKMNGFEAVQTIMAESPRPIVVVTTTISDRLTGATFKAIEAGALAVVGKPIGLPGEDPDADKLIATLKAMSDVKVVQRRPWLSMDRKPPISSHPHPNPKIGDVNLVAMGVSTGGPPALHKILSALDDNFPVPIVVVQHITPGFVVGLAHWLNGTTPLHVQVAENNQLLTQGHVYLAPDDHHLVIRSSNKVSLKKSGPIRGHRPSADALFESVATTLHSRAIGVTLTGMGEDGARGLLAMAQAGAYTLAQDEASCVVFGMPKVAIKLGAVQEVLPLDKLASRLNHLVAARKFGE